jgi:porin
MRPAWLITLALGCGSATVRADEPGAGAAAPLLKTSVAYTGERWQAVAGGIDRGGAYLDNVDLQAEIDGGRAFGVPGLRVFLYGLYNNGHEFDGRYVGSAQGISNIEALPAWHVFEAWAESPLGPGTLRVGLYNLNSEFDVNQTGGVFLNPSHGIGTDIAQTGRNGPSIFPVTSLAVRYAFPVADWQVRLVALDGVPGDPAHPSRTTVKFNSGDGALLVGEVEHALGPGRAAVGVWHYTGKFEDQVALDPQGQALRRSGETGVYGIVEGRAWTEPGDDAQGLSLFLRAGLADDQVNPFRAYVGAGAVYTGALPGRPRDQLGLAVASARTGSPFRTAVALAGGQAGTSETNVELAYRIEIADGWFLQPDVQYVANPAADPSVVDAWVVGLRFKAQWGWER